MIMEQLIFKGHGKVKMTAARMELHGKLWVMGSSKEGPLILENFSGGDVCLCFLLMQVLPGWSFMENFGKQIYKRARFFYYQHQCSLITFSHTKRMHNDL